MQEITTRARIDRSLILKTWKIKLTLVFASGCLGGLLNSLTVWLFSITGITGLFGVAIAPTLTPTWLYPRIVWGGIWGFLFFWNSCHKNYLSHSLIYGLFPTFVQLFIIFPLSTNKGLMGVELGRLTPLFIIWFNSVWAVSTALWLKSISDFQTRYKN